MQLFEVIIFWWIDKSAVYLVSLRTQCFSSFRKTGIQSHNFYVVKNFLNNVTLPILNFISVRQDQDSLLVKRRNDNHCDKMDSFSFISVFQHV